MLCATWKQTQQTRARQFSLTLYLSLSHTHANSHTHTRQVHTLHLPFVTCNINNSRARYHPVLPSPSLFFSFSLSQAVSLSHTRYIHTWQAGVCKVQHNKCNINKARGRDHSLPLSLPPSVSFSHILSLSHTQLTYIHGSVMWVSRCLERLVTLKKNQWKRRPSPALSLTYKLTFSLSQPTYIHGSPLFVTWNIKNARGREELRGCIGNLSPMDILVGVCVCVCVCMCVRVFV